MCRLEDDLGDGPFEFVRKLWAKGHTDEANEFFYGLPKAIGGWLHIKPRTPIELLFAEVMGTTPETMPPEYWEPTPDHPHHLDDVPDPVGDMDYTWKVGCKDEAQLEWWFPRRSFAYLAAHGFRRVLYTCDEQFIRLGQYQLMFCADNIIAVKKEKLV